MDRQTAKKGDFERVCLLNRHAPKSGYCDYENTRFTVAQTLASRILNKEIDNDE